MRIAYSLSCLAVLATLSAPAFSANKTMKLLEVSGKVLVTTADGIVPAEVGQVIADGNRVFVGDEAIARLAAADGACEVMLPPSRVTIIKSSKLCSDVQITPTAANAGPGGLPPVIVGLGFFGAVVGTAVVTSLSNKKPVTTP